MSKNNVKNNIVNLKGFDAIYGKKLFLGTCVGYNSMTRDFYYMDAGNKFWELLDKVCNTNDFSKLKNEYIDKCKTIKKITKNVKKQFSNKINQLENDKSNIRDEMINKIKNFGIGIADIIESCDNTTKSSDNGIIRNTIVYNQELPKLINNADAIVLNGKGRTKQEFYIAVNRLKIDLSQKKVILVISSSGAANRYYKEREQMWKNII